MGPLAFSSYFEFFTSACLGESGDSFSACFTILLLVGLEKRAAGPGRQLSGEEH